MWKKSHWGLGRRISSSFFERCNHLGTSGRVYGDDLCCGSILGYGHLVISLISNLIAPSKRHSFFLFFTRIHTNYTRAAFAEKSEMKIKPREENDRSKELTELTVDQNYGHLAHANFSRLHPRRNSRLGIEQHVHGLTYASCEWLRKWELRRLEEGNCNGRWMEEQSQPRIYNAARHNISQANQLA